MIHAIVTVVATIFSMAFAYVCFLVAMKLVRVAGRFVGIAAFKARDEIEKRDPKILRGIRKHM